MNSASTPFWSQPTDQLFTSLKSTADGLSGAEAVRPLLLLLLLITALYVAVSEVAKRIYFRHLKEI